MLMPASSAMLTESVNSVFCILRCQKIHTKKHGSRNLNVAIERERESEIKREGEREGAREKER